MMTLGPDDRVLDVGSGLGGPGRQIAAATGARVHGVDITAEYVNAATWLTHRTGTEDRVSFQHGDISDVSTVEPYDAAITMHVQMNIEDKEAWYRAIAERLRPGATLAIWEVCTVSGDLPTWPTPWSMTGTDSHLTTAPALQAAVETAGFTTVEWSDESAWVRQWFASLPAAAPGAPAPATLLDDGRARATHFAEALDAGVIAVVLGTFRRN